MNLTDNQKNFIKQHPSWSAIKISKKLSVDVEFISEYKRSLLIKEYPFWFKIFLALIPLLFLLLLEFGLHLGNYGYRFETFVETNENSEYLKLNPELTFKYFSGFKLPMNFIPDAFKKTKDDSTFRIFVFGGSSTAGWPYSGNEAFPRRIRRHFEIIYPERRFEVINFGISAINSYTINDIVDDALLHNPDLVVIYAGHNEYYGALGVGSSSTLGTSKFLVKTILSLKKFRTYQLLENIVAGVKKLFTPSGGIQSTTTMEMMIGESEIPLHSDLYKAGIEQYRNNMAEVLEKIKRKNIPFIWGKLTSNLMQKPFISAKNVEPAISYYNEAEEQMKNGNYAIARDNFIKAKELDLLRFRAPNEMNKIIDELSNKFECITIDFDSLFTYHSENKIPGYNIFVDHLHPTFKGHNLMGDEIAKSIINHKILFPTQSTEHKKIQIDSIISFGYANSKLDLAFADLTLRVLLGSYPFQKKGTKNIMLAGFKGDNIQNKIALEIHEGKTTPLAAYKKNMDYFLNNSMFDDYFSEVSSFLDQRPYYSAIYLEGIENLQSKGKNDLALKLVMKLHQFAPSNYTNSVLGMVNFDQRNYQNALTYFGNAVKIRPNDEVSSVYLAASEFMLKVDWKKNISTNLEVYFHRIKETAESYLKTRRLYDAEIFLRMLYNIHPDQFSTKWLGIVNIEKRQFNKALPYLEESLNFNQKDAIVLYNLAICYWEENELKKAKSTIEESLKINPNFTPAINWKNKHIR